MDGLKELAIGNRFKLGTLASLVTHVAITFEILYISKQLSLYK